MGAAAWSPSLDKILGAATWLPVELGPGVDEQTVLLYRATNGIASQAGHELARYIDRIAADRNRARDIACSLEGELAHLTARVAEAVRWLELAASYSPSEDCDAAIGDALAALRAPT